MGQWEKLLDCIHNNPKTVTFDELDKILQRAGYVRRQPRSGASHYVSQTPQVRVGKMRIYTVQHLSLTPPIESGVRWGFEASPKSATCAV